MGPSTAPMTVVELSVAKFHLQIALQLNLFLNGKMFGLHVVCDNSQVMTSSTTRSE